MAIKPTVGSNRRTVSSLCKKLPLILDHAWLLGRPELSGPRCASGLCNHLATPVAGFKRWESLCRFVKRGEKRITILAPILVNRKNDEKVAKEKEGKGAALAGFKPVYVWEGVADRWKAPRRVLSG